MSLTEHLRRYSYEQQHLGKTARSAKQALCDVVAVYSAHPSAPLSLFARTKNLDGKKFRALEETRDAIRLGAMRRSIHLMPRETAPKIIAATIGQDPKMLARRLQIARVTANQYAEFKRHVLKNVREPMSVRELRVTTGEKEAGLGTLLRGMSDEGLVLRVGAAGLRSNDLRYVPTMVWLGEEMAREEQESARVWLVREYLRAFGPARVQDVLWWVGITKTAAVKTLSHIETMDVGNGYLLLKEQAVKFEKSKPVADGLAILPKWDAYTMGYAPDGRERFVTRDMQTRIYDRAGDGYGAILLNGLAVAAWDLRGTQDKLDVNIDWFEKPSAKLKERVKEEFGAIAKFLQSQGATIQHLGDESSSRLLGRLR